MIPVDPYLWFAVWFVVIGSLVTMRFMRRALRGSDNLPPGVVNDPNAIDKARAERERRFLATTLDGPRGRR